MVARHGAISSIGCMTSGGRPDQQVGAADQAAEDSYQQDLEFRVSQTSLMAELVSGTPMRLPKPYRPRLFLFHLASCYSMFYKIILSKLSINFFGVDLSLVY
jgi:hypothetical protein